MLAFAIPVLCALSVPLAPPSEPLTPSNPFGTFKKFNPTGLLAGASFLPPPVTSQLGDAAVNSFMHLPVREAMKRQQYWADMTELIPLLMEFYKSRAQLHTEFEQPLDLVAIGKHHPLPENSIKEEWAYDKSLAQSKYQKAYQDLTFSLAAMWRKRATMDYLKAVSFIMKGEPLYPIDMMSPGATMFPFPSFPAIMSMDPAIPKFGPMWGAGLGAGLGGSSKNVAAAGAAQIMSQMGKSASASSASASATNLFALPTEHKPSLPFNSTGNFSSSAVDEALDPLVSDSGVNLVQVAAAVEAELAANLRSIQEPTTPTSMEPNPTSKAANIAPQQILPKDEPVPMPVE